MAGDDHDDAVELNDLVRRLNASVGRAPEPVRPDAPPGPVGPGPRDPAARDRLHRLLDEARARDASDVLIVHGYPPTLRVHGELRAHGEAPLAAAEARQLCLALVDDDAWRRLEGSGAVDVALERSGSGRLRCNVHRQKGELAAAIRLLPSRIPSLESLGLPASCLRLAALRRGLVLVTGPTGSGKSTTLAALVDTIRRTRAVHVLTIEQPVEYRHEGGVGVVEQIEIGRDAPAFADALRGALRQDPDVVMVGEMRDRDTIGMALTAAETGHLVLSTLHTNDAVQSIDRIVDVFAPAQQDQVRAQLSLALEAIVSQRLVPEKAGGRCLAAEVMWTSDAIRNLIRTRNLHQVRGQMAMEQGRGSVLLEASLAALVRDGRISGDEARAWAPHPQELDRYLR